MIKHHQLHQADTEALCGLMDVRPGMRECMCMASCMRECVCMVGCIRKCVRMVGCMRGYVCMAGCMRGYVYVVGCMRVRGYVRGCVCVAAFVGAFVYQEQPPQMNLTLYLVFVQEGVGRRA